MKKTVLFILLISLFLANCRNKHSKKSGQVGTIVQVDSSLNDSLKAPSADTHMSGKENEIKGTKDHADPKIIFEYPDTSVYIYHVHVGKIDSVNIGYFFLTLKKHAKKTGSPIFVKINEYSAPDKLHVIDSFPVDNYKAKWVFHENCHYHHEFLLQHFDNLVLSGHNLLYYKPLYDSINHSNVVRDYFSYSIGSNKRPVKIDSVFYSGMNNRFSFSEAERIFYCKRSGLTFYCNNYNILVLHTPQTFDKLRHKEPFKLPVLDSSQRDLDLRPYFREFGIDANKLFIGGLCFVPEQNYLLFDNSGVNYACIWLFDMNTKILTKIIPEHQAIHPFFYEDEVYDFLVYSEKNTIRQCTRSILELRKNKNKVSSETQFREFLFCFGNTTNNVIPGILADAFLSNSKSAGEFSYIGKITPFWNRNTNESDVGFELNAGRIVKKTDNYVAVLVSYTEYEPGHEYAYTYIITYDTYGKILDFEEFNTLESGDYLSREKKGQFVNDTVFKSTSIDVTLDIHPVNGGGEQSMETNIDTLESMYYYIFPDGKIEPKDDHFWY
jgi:hypothetical protein